MATQIINTLTDDINGKDGATTVTFGYQGVNYEIDLDTLNAGNLKRSLEKYIAAARVVEAKKSRKVTAKKAGTEAAKIRAWAVENGVEVGARGRLAPEVMDAYRAAHAEPVEAEAVEVAETVAE